MAWAGEFKLLADFVKKAWFGNLPFEVQDLLEDGRAQITEEDGNLSFLQLYAGNQKVSRPEAYEILKGSSSK